MRKFAEQVKAWYEAGRWNQTMVYNALDKGRITEEEYKEIIGLTYGTGT